MFNDELSNYLDLIFAITLFIFKAMQPCRAQ